MSKNYCRDCLDVTNDSFYCQKCLDKHKSINNKFCTHCEKYYPICTKCKSKNTILCRCEDIDKYIDKDKDKHMLCMNCEL